MVKLYDKGINVKTVSNGHRVESKLAVIQEAAWTDVSELNE